MSKKKTTAAPATTNDTKTASKKKPYPSVAAKAAVHNAQLDSRASGVYIVPESK